LPEPVDLSKEDEYLTALAEECKQLPEKPEIPMVGSIPVDYSEPTQSEIDAANTSCAEVFETDEWVSVNRHEVEEPKPMPDPLPNLNDTWSDGSPAHRPVPKPKKKRLRS